MILRSIATFWIFCKELDMQSQVLMAVEELEKALDSLLEATIKDGDDASVVNEVSRNLKKQQP